MRRLSTVAREERGRAEVDLMVANLSFGWQANPLRRWTKTTRDLTRDRIPRLIIPF
jgi:hypothetical protein